MAVLWDKMVFSFNSNSWNWSGFKTFLFPIRSRRSSQSSSRSGGVRIGDILLEKIFQLPRTTARPTAYGSHCIWMMAVPTTRRIEGM
jgi:hypothetical protein